MGSIFNSNRNKGFLIPNFVALLCFTITISIKYLNEAAGVILVSSQFVLLPIGMGLISAYYWRDLELTRGQRLKYTLINFGIATLLSAGFMQEGVICLIIVSPLVVGFILVGVYAGKIFYEKRKNDTKSLNLSLAGILIILAFVDILGNHDHQAEVVDVLHIDAPPETVWNYVVEFEEIKELSNYVLFDIGLPKPVSTTVSGHYVGAERKCIFDQNHTFDEIMTVFNPPNKLVFDIVKQPDHDEIMGHLKLLKGEFLLQDNGDGTTTLKGTSWYQLYIFPTLYFDLWAEQITREVHLRVMKHIKKLAESEHSKNYGI